jgi:hypothetical protein
MWVPRWAPGKFNIHGARIGNIVPGVFTPVLAKHSKSFSLIDCVSVGVDRMQRNFEPTGKRTLVLRRCFNSCVVPFFSPALSFSEQHRPVRIRFWVDLPAVRCIVLFVQPDGILRRLILRSDWLGFGSQSKSNQTPNSRIGTRQGLFGF